MVDNIHLKGLRVERVQPAAGKKPVEKAAGKSFRDVLKEVSKLGDKAEKHLKGVVDSNASDLRKASLEFKQAYDLTMKMSSKISQAYKTYQKTKST